MLSWGCHGHPKSQDWSWTLEGEFPEGSRSELPEKLNTRPHKTPQTRGKRGQKRRNTGETRTKPGRRGAPEITAEKAAKRTHAHGGPLPGQMDGVQKRSVWKQDDFQGSSFSKVGGPAARLRRIRKGGRQAAGAEHLSGTCDSERKEETKLMAPTYVFFPPRDGRPSGCKRQEDGGTWHSLARCGGGERQRLDCSPGAANALTRVARAEAPSPDSWEELRSPPSCTDGARNPPGPALTEEGFPPSTSHLSPGQQLGWG